MRIIRMTMDWPSFKDIKFLRLMQLHFECLAEFRVLDDLSLLSGRSAILGG